MRLLKLLLLVAAALGTRHKTTTPAGDKVGSGEEVGYAMGLADESYRWYKDRAIHSRTAYRISETTLLVVAAAIPTSAAIDPSNAIAPAVLGGVVVVLTGLRAVFHWQDNYLRFSGAREAVEAERRSYNTGAKPYDDPATRDQILAAAVSKIEQAEMAGWNKIASPRPSP
jgi:hypothetical protein